MRFETPWDWWRRRRSEGLLGGRRKRPLREFIYLDEVSLRSLLSSQTGEIKESVSEQSQTAALGELSLKLAGSVPLTAKGEATSRFQTSNSSTLQTSRKATVQSWFRDLHDRSELRLISPMDGVEPLRRVQDLGGLDPSIAAPGSSFARGSLVEFRVRLAAHPVFHLTTMMTEFTGMTDDYGELIPDGSRTDFAQIAPMVKVLQRLMAGLIPISAEAVDYVVLEHDEADYIVHRDAAAGLSLETRPLKIMGVTDHEAYWKDLRRVLFTESTFTMLCRIARPGIQRDWTPVKLVDVFNMMAPDFARQISLVWRAPFSADRTVAPVEISPPDSAFKAALIHYGEALLAPRRAKIPPERLEAVEGPLAALIDRLQRQTMTVSDQKSAFWSVRSFLSKEAGVRVAAARDIVLREQARSAAGLSLFPRLNPPAAQLIPAAMMPDEDSRLLDVEVVAIYW